MILPWNARFVTFVMLSAVVRVHDKHVVSHALTVHSVTRWRQSCNSTVIVCSGSIGH